MMSLVTLRSKIYLGFAVIVLLVLMNTLIGYVGSNFLREAHQEMQQVSALNAEVMEVDYATQDLRLHVNRYVASGYVSLRDDILSLNQELAERIRLVKLRQTDEDIEAIFQRMSEHLAEYARQFSMVVEERELRASLVNQTLPEQATKIAERIHQLRALLPTGDVVDQDRVALLQCESSFSQAEKMLLRYFESPDSALVNDALAQLSDARNSIEPLTTTTESQVIQQALIEELHQYGELGVRAVQATRGYLYLVNVVMAGEASEISHYSDRLRTTSATRQKAIAQELETITANVNRLVAVGILLAMAVALLVAARLAFLIVQPITALTRTFRALAAGETVSSIPGAERADEVGEMAKAARVFSDQNRSTRELLEKAEALGKELKQQAEELEATNADLDSFAYVASHDLKSPLRGIRQLASWIEEDAGESLSGDAARYLVEMRRRVEKMENLLDDLLDYSRVGRMEPEAELVETGAVLENICEMVDNPGQVKVDWPEDMPALQTVRVAIEQVLMNLVGNAIKHNDKGTEGKVDVSWQRENGHYHFKVTDNGPGIDAKHHDRVFKMYQRVGDTKVDGSGMGLAIVKKRIEHFGGTIMVDSSLGEGATFRFTWPTDTPAEELEDE